MAQVVKVKTKTTKRERKKNIPPGMQACNMCGGRGYHKKAGRT